VTLVSADWLRRLLPFMLAAVLVFTLFRNDLGRVHAPKHAAGKETLLAVLIAAVLGFYDGFFGPGTGSFFIFLFVHVLGFDFLHAVACSKILNTTTNLAALVLFGFTGHVWWQFMLPMAVANVVGSQLGTRLTLRHGSAFIRLVFIAVVGALILKTGYDAYCAGSVLGPLAHFNQPLPRSEFSHDVCPEGLQPLKQCRIGAVTDS